jgi:hypothetical protein
MCKCADEQMCKLKLANQHIVLILFYSFLLSCLGACREDESKKINYFFDLKGYMNEQANRLDSLGAGVIKTITKDGKTENKELKKINWKKELLPFMESDINRPAWKDSYSADTLITDQATAMSYEALDPSLTTRKLTIIQHADGSCQISIRNKTSNYLYKSEQELEYYSKGSYYVEGSQDVWLAGRTTYHIAASIK